jgi:hypothetical protein
VLNSVERVFADKVETVAGLTLSSRKSHMTLVVALPFAFFIGGNTQARANMKLPDDGVGTRSIDVLRLEEELGGATLQPSLTMAVPRVFSPAAHIEELNGDKTVLVFAGFERATTTNSKVESLRFSTKTYAPTPMPTPEYTDPPPTPMPPTPPPTPQVLCY